MHTRMLAIGVAELLLILAVIALIAGVGKAGEIAKLLGRGVAEFQGAELNARRSSRTHTFAQTDETLLVFLSSVMNRRVDDVAAERRALAESLQRHPLFSLWRFEDAPADDELVHSYLSKVEECHIFILLIGADITDAVRAEYDLAAEKRKPMLVFVKNVPSRSPRAAELIESVQQRGIRYKEFTRTRELEYEVLRALYSCVIKYYRRGLTRNAYLGCLAILRALDRGSGGDSELDMPAWQPFDTAAAPRTRLTASAIERIADMILPAANKQRDQEEYDELVGDLAGFGITTEAELIDLLTGTLDAVTRTDAEQARLFRGVPDPDDRRRHKESVYFYHVGLIRTALDVEFAGKWSEVEFQGQRPQC